MIKIIVVEDDVKLNNLIKTILEKNSYIVDSAYNPNEAFLKMEKSSYNLIISGIIISEIIRL